MGRRTLLMGWGMCVALLLVAVIAITSSREQMTNPSAESFGPSGVHAFYSLIAEEGIAVRVDRRAVPSLGPKDLAIVFSDEPISGSSFLVEDEQPDSPKFLEGVKKGATALVFDTSSLKTIGDLMPEKPAEPLTLTHATNPKLKLGVIGPDSVASAYERIEPALWMRGDQKEVIAQGFGEGILISIPQAGLAMNQYIAEAQNAEFLMALVRQALPDGGEVVFLEAAVGNVSKETIWMALGPWANAAWWQLFIVFFVAVYVVGSSFGLPLADVRPIRGARDLVEAFGNLMHRGKKTDLAASLLVQEANRRLRRLYRVPNRVSDEQMLLKVDNELRLAYEVAFASLRKAPMDGPDLATQRFFDRLRELEKAHRRPRPRT